MLNQLNILPRWIILICDLIICCISLVIGYTVGNNFDVLLINHVEFSRNALIALVINTIVFISVKTYAGIIRYTSAQDSFRILLSVLISNIIIFVIHLMFVAFAGNGLVSIKILFINGLMCFLLMISYRMVAKYFFLYIKNLNLDKKKVVIYGAGEAGVAAKRTFEHDEKVNKNIIAFIDDDPRKIGKRLLGTNIMSVNEFPALILQQKVDELIFATHDILPDRKNKIIDLCLEQNIKVLTIPMHEDWANGELKPAQIQTVKIEDLLDRQPIQIDLVNIQKELADKRILITGAAGSIGSEIVRQLIQFETGLIIMCDQSETALHNLYLEIHDLNNEALNFHAFIGDVRDESRMIHLFKTYKPHYVYHAAAYKHVPLMEDNVSEAIKTNVLGTKTIADLSVKYGVEKFVMISTDKAVNPTNIMGASKRIAEIYVQSLNNSIKNIFSINEILSRPFKNNKEATKFVTTRFGNVLGSNGSVIPRFKEQIQKGGPVTVTHPEITRYFMTIPEACRLVLEAGCMGNGGEIFIFDMGRSIKIIDLAKRMIKLAGLIPNQDINIEYSGLRPGEKLFEELLNDHENTMPTHHEKIMIGKIREYVFEEVEVQIETLINYAKNNDEIKVVMTMKQLVQEFKSKNSAFEELDYILKSS